jgi:hypothetical protein
LFPSGPENGPDLHGREAFFPDEINWKSAELEKQIRKRNAVATIIGLTVIAAFALVFVHSATTAVRAGCVGLILFAVCMVVRLITMGGPAKMRPEDTAECATFYREELTRQYRFLMSAWYGYAGLVLPACVLMLFGSHVYEFFVFIYLLIFAELVLREAEWFQRELRQLDGALQTTF